MIRYLFITLLVFCGFVSKGQAPVADFSISSSTGCSPLSVSFTDKSTNSPKFWNWDFGNGQLSNVQNPTVGYGTPGTYTVTLVVRNNDGTNGITKTNLITVNPSPVANFSSNLETACLGASIRFTDLTQPQAGTLTSWEWNFGDGTSSTEQNPSKTYSASGYYNVSLKATSSTGCSGTITRGRFVRIVSGVKADFKDPVITTCEPPFAATFLNETSGPGRLTYAWDFGNGSTSAIKDPTLTIAAAGTLNVQLTATSDLGCSDVIKRPVVIKNNSTAFNLPDTACLNLPLILTNTSNPAAVSSRWDFGDGTTSVLTSPSKTFTTVGIYNVKLVNTYPSCVDSLVKKINIIASPPVDFTSNVQGACKPSLSVTFQDASPNSTKWSWNFGDGGTGSGKTISHNYTAAGEYDVTLTITTASGCESTLKKTKFIRIVPPTASIQNAPTGGCIPFTFTPVSNSSAVESITAYLWDFGDGSPTSTLQSPSHVYPNTGNYNIKLTVTTQGGCTSTTTVTNGVSTGTPAVPEFSANRVQSCADSIIQFTNLSTPATGLAYFWDFGDNTSSNIKDPSHQYLAPGVYTVQLTASNNGCAKSISKPGYITVQPPVARFNYFQDCGARPIVNFLNTSTVDNTLPVSYLWDFGFGNNTSNLKDPTFQYPTQGSYTVTLTVNNGNCSSKLAFGISLIPETADFTISPNDTLCRNEPYTFAAFTNNPSNITEHHWSVDGAPFFQGSSTLMTRINRNGDIPISLYIVDKTGCMDTITKTVTNIGPFPKFSSIDTVACEKSTVTFIDESTPTADIVQWKFDFGDGSTQTFTAPPFTHIYQTAGQYNVTLTVTSRTGCTPTYTLANYIRISKPVADFGTEFRLYCPGGLLQFNDSSKTTGALTYLWNFGDGGTSTAQNPTHAYPKKDTTYSVALTVTDVKGCTGTITKTAYIQIKSPKAAFSIADTTSICPLLETKFVFQGKDLESFYWDFGDGTTSFLDTTSHFYNTYGAFKAKLFVTGYGGCLDSAEHNVTIYNPYATTVITENPVTGCNELLVDFTVKSAPSTFRTFFFGDGAADVSQKENLQHFYGAPNFYNPYVALRDSTGCQVEVGSSQIKILGASPFFSPDKKIFCDFGTVYFTNYTIGNDVVTSSTWDFDDGTTSNDRDAIHAFNRPGEYIVSLSVVTSAGCAKTLTDTVRVYATPQPSIISDSVVCINSPVPFRAGLAATDTSVTVSWNFGNGQTSNQLNPQITYSTAGTFTVTLEVVNPAGCKMSVTKSIRVAPLPVITVLNNPVIPVGSSIPMPVTYTPGIQTYTWTPVTGLSCSDCAAPVAKPLKTATYAVNVVDSIGCKSNASVTITVICNEKNYFVPNTFSPNNDGNNDQFYPRGSSITRIQSMRIFSRWGEMVFEKRNFSANSASEGWNGMYKGKGAEAGVYVYIIEFICDNGAIIPFKGDVTLVR